MIDKGFFLFCMVLSFYITIRSVQKFSYSDETLDGIVKQFKAGFIADIIAIGKDDNIRCPSGFTDLITNFDWPGNFKGCGCLNSKGDYVYYINVCPSDQKKCIKVDETPSKYFPYWKEFRLCYKRSKDDYADLYNAIIPQSNFTQCLNSTHKVCGIIDDLNNLLCLPSEKACPVTFLMITPSEERVNKYKANDPDASVTLVNDKLYLVTSSIPAKELRSLNTIYNSLRAHLSFPCLNYAKSPSSELLFELMKNKFDLQCDKFKENNTEITDQSYLVIDQYQYSDYLKDNSFYSILQSKLQPFNINIDQKTISLYGKAYPGWSFACRNQNKDSFKNFLNLSNKMNQLSISTILHSFLILVTLIAIGVCSFYFLENFEKMFYLIILGFIALNLIYPIQVITKSNWVINSLADDDGVGCAGVSMNILLYEISDACLSLLYSYVALLCMTIICLIVFLIVIFHMLQPSIKQFQERLIQLRQIG